MNKFISHLVKCCCLFWSPDKKIVSFQYCILFKGKRKEILPHRHIIIANLTKYPIVVVVACCDLLTKKSYLFNIWYIYMYVSKNIQVFAIFSILYTIQREEEGDTTSQAHYYRQSHYSIMQIMHSLVVVVVVVVVACCLVVISWQKNPPPKGRGRRYYLTGTLLSSISLLHYANYA